MEIRNRWDIYKMLIIEPDANFDNMFIDVMLSNLTRHFETISNGANCETGKRGLPNFMLRQIRDHTLCSKLE